MAWFACYKEADASGLACYRQTERDRLSDTETEREREKKHTDIERMVGGWGEVAWLACYSGADVYGLACYRQTNRERQTETDRDRQTEKTREETHVDRAHREGGR